MGVPSFYMDQSVREAGMDILLVLLSIYHMFLFMFLSYLNVSYGLLSYFNISLRKYHLLSYLIISHHTSSHILSLQDLNHVCLLNAPRPLPTWRTNLHTWRRQLWVMMMIMMMMVIMTLMKITMVALMIIMWPHWVVSYLVSCNFGKSPSKVVFCIVFKTLYIV